MSLVLLFNFPAGPPPPLGSEPFSGRLRRVGRPTDSFRRGEEEDLRHRRGEEEAQFWRRTEAPLVRHRRGQKSEIRHRRKDRLG